jgi:hypothetical protein
LDDARWQRYAGQLLDFAVPADAATARPRVWRGEGLPIYVRVGPTRGPNNGRKVLWVAKTISVAGDLLAERQWKRSHEMPLQTAGGTDRRLYPAELDPAKVAAAADGPQTVRVILDTVVSEDIDYLLHEATATALVRRRFEFTVPWELVPAGTATVELLPDDAASRAAMVAALNVRRVRLGPSGFRAEVEAANPPLPIAHDVFLRAGARTWPLSEVRFEGRGQGRYYVEGPPAAPGEEVPERVDVLLRPNPARARETPDMDRIWGGEIVILDVPVEREP